ncbi:MAG TPA: BCCT family transporter [Desulfotignum sp.]|nr:BCCT family transporter [Desulfotignum sp.]
MNKSLPEEKQQYSHGKMVAVFVISLVFSAATAIWGIFNPQSLADSVTRVTMYCLDSFDWVFLLSITFFIFFSFFLGFSRFGDIKLGRPDETPEFSTVSWVAMLFAAGMGAGLLFWGVAEPLHHYMAPPPGKEAMTPEAARWAMVVTNLHWGIHAWGIYAMGALVLGYYSFRRGYPMLASAPITAVFSGKTGSALGFAAEVVAVVAVAFGLAGSLGMGVLQINSGLGELFGTPSQNVSFMIGILAVLILFYMIPLSTKLDKGIKVLSNINIAVVVMLMLYVLFLGPTAFALSTFVTSLGDYVTNVINLSFRLYPYSGETEWSRIWTLTYLIWWIAWAPFVGIFIARISRGRTIREFVITVILIPTLFSLLWFAVFGGTGIFIERFGEGGLASLVLEEPSKALFSLFSYYPFARILGGITILLVFIFLSTSAASGGFVLAMMTSGGDLEPSALRKLFWGAIIAALTAAVLFTGGGVVVLRSIAISGALPFTIIMIIQVACLYYSLAAEEGTADYEHEGVSQPSRNTEVTG